MGSCERQQVGKNERNATIAHVGAGLYELSFTNARGRTDMYMLVWAVGDWLWCKEITLEEAMNDANTRS